MSLSTELLGSWRLVSREDRGADGQRLVGALSPGDVGKVVTRELRIVHGRLVISLETTTAHGEPVVRRLEWERA
jgi:hypothetical protein